MESEFIALELECSKAEWLRNRLSDIPIWESRCLLFLCIVIHRQQSQKSKAKSTMGKSWHIKLRHNIVRQLMSSVVITMDFVKSEKNLVDPLTKGSNKNAVQEASMGMGLKPI